MLHRKNYSHWDVTVGQAGKNAGEEGRRQEASWQAGKQRRDKGQGCVNVSTWKLPRLGNYDPGQLP